MKYSFCYTITKIIVQDKSKTEKNKHLFIKNDDGSEIELICGPWRETEEEAIKDGKLYKKNPDTFFKMLKEL